MDHRLVVCLFAAMPLVAQTTTWTSFDDRLGHTLGTDGNGMVLMFGGASLGSSNILRGDTAILETVPQTTATRWVAVGGASQGRAEHAMAAAYHGAQPIFVAFGGLLGQSGSAQPTNVTSTFDGGGWEERGSTQVPSARVGHAMATDSVNNQVYMFGGLAQGLPRNDLWRWDPMTFQWSSLPVAGAPPARRDHCFAFDPGAGLLYMFGGIGFPSGSGGLLNDLWVFNPTTATWSLVSTPIAPSPRKESAIAYSLTNGIVLFGGQDAQQAPLDDTWTLSGGVWTLRNPTHRPQARFGHAMTVDSDLQRVLLFGGSNGSGQTLPQTWRWVGVDWEPHRPAPSARSGASLAYRKQADQHLLFGGREVATGGEVAQTWQLEGVNWSELSPSAAPAARAEAGMAFDSARQAVVLYGGRSGGPCGSELGDTWEWNGASWLLRNPATSPPPAAGAPLAFDSKRNKAWLLWNSRMWSYDGVSWDVSESPEPVFSAGYCYDSVRGCLVTFGGRTNSASWIDETWEWDGVWHRRPRTPGGPAPRFTVMAYDTARQSSVMVSGWGLLAPYLDTWTWNGTVWTQAAAGIGRYNMGAAYDEQRSRVVTFGGQGGPGTDTMEWDGISWTQASPGTSPLGGLGASLAYDPVHRNVLMYGGYFSTVVNETWTYDGVNWVQRFPVQSPPARRWSHLTYDSHSGEMLLFGGADMGAALMDDTWSWNGSNWTLRTPAARPTARAQGAMFSTGTRTVLWSGSSVQGLTSDMWEWDGDNWFPLSGSAAPTQRTNFGMAYDTRRDRTVVFGGMSGCDRGSATFLQDTWEWTGTGWLQRTPLHSPSPRAFCKLTYDEARARIVLFGGADAVNTFQDVWEWDGSDWIAMAPNALPPGSLGHDLDFDTTRRVAVLFGSSGTWDYGPTNPAHMESFGTGCLSSAGVPTLRPLPWAGPWIGDRVEIDVASRPAGLMLFAWGLTEYIPPLNLAFAGSPACSLYLSVDQMEFRLSGETRYVSFVLPSDPGLVGMPLFAQAGFLDQGQVGAPIVTSNALRMTLGLK